MINFDNVVKFGHTDMLDKDVFMVSWILGRFCNYKCSYCWPYAHSQKKDHRPTELCLQTIDEIKYQARNNGFNSFHFSLSGGEPTFHPGYLQILQFLADDYRAKYQSIHMTTNMSQNMSFFQKYLRIAKQFDDANITASFHHEHLNTPDLVNGFRDKLVFLKDNGIKIIINMVMVPETFYELHEISDVFVAAGLNVTLKPQSNESATQVVDGYTPDMLSLMREDLMQEPQMRMINSDGTEWMFDQAERFNAYGFNNFKGWMCNSGYQSVVIREPDGSVKRSYSCKDVPLGYIDKGFDLFKEPKICISPSCVSSADSKITKVRI